MQLIADVLTWASRSFTLFRRRHSRLRQLVPGRLAVQAVRAGSVLTEARRWMVPVLERSRHENVFHCCVQKTGSIWIKSVLSDVRVFQYHGLSHYHYQSRELGGADSRPATARSFERPFPRRSIVGPLYLSYDAYLSIPKRGSWRGFFVARDPRDVLVSWYFSTRKTHVVVPGAAPAFRQVREQLNRLSLEDGLLLGIDFLASQGRWEALRSWAPCLAGNREEILLRYEDLARDDAYPFFRRLFDFLDFRIPEEALREVIGAYSFERLTGRRRGQEDTGSHLRSGTSGGWRRYFTGAVESRFRSVAGDVVEALGYEG